MDITQSDLNRQMQQLVAEYKRTGRDEFKHNAEALPDEFDPGGTMSPRVQHQQSLMTLSPFWLITRGAFTYGNVQV